MDLFSDPESAGASPAGHVDAVLSMARKLGTDALMGEPGSSENMLCQAMAVATAAGVVSPGTTVLRTLKDPVLGEPFRWRLKIGEAGAEEMRGALVWLAGRQDEIEKQLATERMRGGAKFIYSVPASCEHALDRIGRKLKAVCSVLCTHGLEPVSVRMHPGKDRDASTIEAHAVDAVARLFSFQAIHVGGSERIPGAGKGGILGPVSDCLATLRDSQVAELVRDGTVSESLFGGKEFAEFTHPSFPDQRLVAHADPKQRGRDGGQGWVSVYRTTLSDRYLSAESVAVMHVWAEELERSFGLMPALGIDPAPVRRRTDAPVLGHALLRMLSFRLLWHLCGAWDLLILEDHCYPDGPEDPSDYSPEALEERLSGREGERNFVEVLPMQGVNKILGGLAGPAHAPEARVRSKQWRAEAERQVKKYRVT